MKNFEEILSDAGVELTDEQKTAITKAMGENYKPIADWQKQVDKVQNLTEQLDSTKEALKKFDGVDAEALNKQIADLNEELKNKETEYQNQIADRDFSDVVKEAIAAANGKNPKAITALLDLETLKRNVHGRGWRTRIYCKRNHNRVGGNKEWNIQLLLMAEATICLKRTL